MHDKQQFIGIIQANEGLIYKVTKIYSYSPEDAQDLYQEIVYQLWKAFPFFRKEAKISTWMYRIALNTAITYSNKQKRKQAHIPIDDVLLNRTDSADIVIDERYEILYAEIKKLNSIQKGIILLHLEGRSYEEIATITGFTYSNVGTRLNRIKQKLIAQLN